MTTPLRIPPVDEIVRTLRIALYNPEERKKNTHEVNCILATCEIITGLPPEWFTPEERTLVFDVLSAYHGDPMGFMNDIMDGSISYTAVCPKELNNRTTAEICALTMKAHAMMYGQVT